MDDIRVVMNSDGVERLLKSSGVLADLDRRARAIASAANASSSWGGYDSEASNVGNRARARVWNVKHGAADDESRNNRLLRSLDAGR